MKTLEQKSLSPRTKPAAHYCKPPPQENWKGGYREIVQVLQGNPLAPTGKSLGWYRRIGYGAEAWSAM